MSFSKVFQMSPKKAQKYDQKRKKLKFSFHYYISIIKTTSGKMEVLGLEPRTLRTGARVANHYTTVTSWKREQRNGYLYCYVFKGQIHENKCVNMVLG